MKKKFIIIIFCFINVAFGQTNYLVYKINGKVSEEDRQGVKPLKVGQLLKSDQVLGLEKGAAITLICKNYALFTINKPGKFELKGLGEKCAAEGHSVTAEYFKFIWEELTHPHESPEDNRRKFMNNKGAVVRGCHGVVVDNIFDTINCYATNAFITWKTNLSIDRITIALCSDEKDGEEISIPVKENYISMDTLKKYAGLHNQAYWSIHVDGEEVCPRKYIRFWSKEDYSVFLDSLKKIIPATTDPAEWNYMMGFYLEKHFFIKEAFDLYQQAAVLDPSSARYKRTAATLKIALSKN